MLNSDEIREAKEKVNACATEIAKTMFKHSDDPKTAVLAVVMVAAGSTRASGIDKHMAMEMFLNFYKDATNFMNEE
jgi:hypothetical protein